MQSSPEGQPQVIVETSTGDEFTRFRATIRDSEMNRLTLIAKEKIAASMPVRVQGNTSLWLGEVVSCVAEAEARWTVHVRVKRSLLII